MVDKVAIRQEARDSLSKSARRNRALRGTAAEKKLAWEPFSGCPTAGILSVKVGRGRLILSEPRGCGIPYTSSFGANSDRSFSGFLPGLTLDEAKLLVYQDAKKHW